jgi:hypothetical protein
VKAVEEGAVAMFTEDIRKSMRQDQSTLESRYANSTLLKRPKEMTSIEYSRKKIKNLMRLVQASATTTPLYATLTSSSSFQSYPMSTVNIMVSWFPYL